MLLLVIYSNEYWYHDLWNVSVMTKQLLHWIKQNNTRELKCEAEPELGISIRWSFYWHFTKKV